MSLWEAHVVVDVGRTLVEMLISEREELEMDVPETLSTS